MRMRKWAEEMRGKTIAHARIRKNRLVHETSIPPGTVYHETLSAIKDKWYMYIHLYKIATSQFHAGSGMCP